MFFKSLPFKVCSIGPECFGDKVEKGFVKYELLIKFKGKKGLYVGTLTVPETAKEYMEKYMKKFKDPFD